MCSINCESTSPSIQFIRHGERHRVFGCPADHVCGTVSKFMEDYDRQTEGVMAAYRFYEVPAKYAMLISMYKGWSAFFANRTDEMASGYKPKTMKQIDEFRARGG